MIADIEGTCPACGQRQLHITVGSGIVTCYNQDCPRPQAASRLLNEAPMTDHLVLFNQRSWTLKHPLIERLDNRLFFCPVHRKLTRLLDGKDSHDHGVYRVRTLDDGEIELVGLP